MLSSRLKLLRNRCCITQKELAKNAKLSLRTITHIEQGLSEQPSIKTMIKIADALNISLDELVGRKFKSSKK